MGDTADGTGQQANVNQANVNQAKDEPIPASHHDQERRKATARPADDDEPAEEGAADGAE